LNVEDLNRLQLSIHNTIEEANQALLNASDGETIDIVAVDISSETITQSIFDTTAAIRDDLACVVSSGYTQFDNYSDEGYAGDAINGIHLKSNYSGLRETTKVSIFYPALEEELTENKLLYIDTNNNYYFTYDGAWTQNANKTIYIMTPKDSSGLHSCYRYELNNINPNAITKTKVFSYSNI
ncbi:MAG: hypothetical protein U9N39_02820, partial [Campylobacterota bacterium]|nr:hypothetical protein [Campylobacterota bacterium]